MLLTDLEEAFKNYDPDKVFIGKMFETFYAKFF